MTQGLDHAVRGNPLRKGARELTDAQKRKATEDHRARQRERAKRAADRRRA